ncbi:Retrovirus-related Pol polyprotein from transposon, partial [Zancudomyces culisetae]
MESILSFEATSGVDPEEWLKQFRLIAKLNKWDDEDWTDLVQLKLGKREQIWYKKNVANFSNWTEFCIEFKKKYVSEEQSFLSYDKLKRIYQEDFDSIDELEYEMEKALDKVGIEDDNARFNWLVSSLKPEFRVKVREEKLKSWDEVISLVSESEMKREENQSIRNVNRFKDNVAGQQSEKTPLNTASPSEGYTAMLEKMEEWSLNLLSRVDEAVEKRLSENRRKRYNNSYPRVVTCYHCHKEGHRKFECPKLKENEELKIARKSNSVNFLEVSRDSYNQDEILAVQRRETIQKRTPYSRKVQSEVRENTKLKGNFKEPMIVEEETKLDSAESTCNPVISTTFSQVKETGLDSDSSKVCTKSKTKSEIRMAEGIQPFSLKDQLSTWCPTITFPQLMSVAPGLNTEMVNLCKKAKKSEINEIRFGLPRTTNCRIIVTVYNEDIWAVVDTGAACSVATPRLLEAWGLVADKEDDQVIITADGKKHYSLGKIKDVPLKIGDHRFHANLTIMQRKDDSLILGMDWLIQHHAELNIGKSELKLPLGKVALLVKLYTRETPDHVEYEGDELYMIIKEDTLDVNNDKRYTDPRIEQLKQENMDIFADDIEQLTQTDMAEHRIILKDETPIKLKPYRIPYHLYNKGHPWTWNSECETATIQIKQKMSSAPTLAHPDWEKEFIVTTDASLEGIGGILSQQFNEGEKPICFISRITNKHEKNYSISHLEGLAVVWCIQKLKYYLWGKHFTVRTDHKSLLQLFDSKEITGRVARWAMILRNYDYTIVHCKGKNNPADMLSRLGPKTLEENSEISVYSLSLSDYNKIKNFITNTIYPENSSEQERKKLRSRAAKYKVSNDSPAELLYGIKLATPATWTPPPEISDVELGIQERIEAIKTDIPELRNVGLNNSRAAKEKEQAVYNRGVKLSVFKEGDIVLKLTEQPQAKLENIWQGPYKVTRRLNKGAYVIMDSEGNRDLVNGDMLKLYHYSKYMLPE